MRRVGVIGDVHASERRLGAALDWLAGQSVDAVICTGDVADGPGSVDACCELLRQAEVRVVRGNHDRWLLTDRVRHIENAQRLCDIADTSRAYLEALPELIELETVAGRLLLCHGVGTNDLRKVWPGTARMPVERSPELDGVLAKGDVRFVVNGHMHYRVLIDFPELLLLNAGTLAARHRPGISVLDFAGGGVVAHEFEDGAVGDPVAEHPLRPGPERRIWRDTQEFDGTWTPVALYPARASA